MLIDQHRCVRIGAVLCVIAGLPRGVCALEKKLSIRCSRYMCPMHAALYAAYPLQCMHCVCAFEGCMGVHLPMHTGSSQADSGGRRGGIRGGDNAGASVGVPAGLDSPIAAPRAHANAHTHTHTHQEDTAPPLINQQRNTCDCWSGLAGVTGFLLGFG